MPEDLTSGLLKKRSWLSKATDRQLLTRRGFALTASVTIGVLVLIVWSLLREGSGFFTTYQRELTVYRQAGLEYCDYINKVVTAHEEIASGLNRAAQAEMATIYTTARARRDAAYQAVSAVEDAAALPRKALEEALGAETKDEALIAKLRAEVLSAQTRAAERVSIGDALTAAEKTALRQQLPALMPEGEGPPALVTELAAAAAAKDVEAREKFMALVTAAEEFEAALDPIIAIHSPMKETALATKAAAIQQHMRRMRRPNCSKAPQRHPMPRSPKRCARTPRRRTLRPSILPNASSRSWRSTRSMPRHSPPTLRLCARPWPRCRTPLRPGPHVI